MNRKEGQEFVVTAERFEKARKVFHDSKLPILLKIFKNRFSSEFPYLSYKEFFSKQERKQEFDMGLIIELEWDKRKDPEFPDAFYQSKVARIKVEPNGSIYFGKKKITPKEWKDWKKTEQSLLKLMNNTKSEEYFQRERKSFALPE